MEGWIQQPPLPAWDCIVTAMVFVLTGKLNG